MILFLFLQIFSLIFADCFNPFFFQWLGLVFGEVEGYHDGGTYAFYFLGFRINDPLGEVEAFGSYLSDGSLHGDMVRTINLCEEVCFNMDDNDTILFPIYIRAYGSEIFRFS